MSHKSNRRSRQANRKSPGPVLKKNREKPPTSAQLRLLRALRRELGDEATGTPATREWAAKEIDRLFTRKGRPRKLSPAANKNAKAVVVSIARDKATERLKLEVAGEQAELKRQTRERMARL
jgi:hypothetical protein